MSINARIAGVSYTSNGWRLTLEPWNRDPPGQNVLFVENPPDPPERLSHLIGLHVWGDARSLLVGEEKFADRESYLSIRLVDDWALKVKHAHERQCGEHPPA